MDNINNSYEKVYLPKVHRLGKTAALITLLLSLVPPLYLSYVLGYHPGWGPIMKGFVNAAMLFSLFWIIEPVAYFSILGVTGTYMSFLSGNTSNMRIPAIAAAHAVLKTEPGSKKAEMAGIIAMSASIIINMAILLVIVFVGVQLLAILPQRVVNSFNYVLPSLMGSMFIMFSKNIERKVFIYMIPIALIIFFSPMPASLHMPAAGLLGIIFSFIYFKVEKVTIKKDGNKEVNVES